MDTNCQNNSVVVYAYLPGKLWTVLLYMLVESLHVALLALDQHFKGVMKVSEVRIVRAVFTLTL